MDVSRYLIAWALATLLAGTTSPSGSKPDCRFIVYNRTPDILDVRQRIAPLRYRQLGTLNPGESLTSLTACEERFVRVAGIGVPSQVGLRIHVWTVYGEAELAPGEAAVVNLTWP